MQQTGNLNQADSSNPDEPVERYLQTYKRNRHKETNEIAPTTIKGPAMNSSKASFADAFVLTGLTVVSSGIKVVVSRLICSPSSSLGSIVGFKVVDVSGVSGVSGNTELVVESLSICLTTLLAKPKCIPILPLKSKK